MKSLFYRLLNVHESEQQTVYWLFFHHFLQGFGLALTFIIANSLFLTEYSVKELPKVYILSGVLVLIAGRIYAWYEHHLDIKILLRNVVFVSFLLLIFLWIGSFWLDAAVFAFGLLSLYQVLYLLYNLEFWGVSALVFNVRQSKRLFGLISSGDMPAKMLGYLVVGLIASFLNLHYLIILSAFSVLASVYFLQKLLNHHEFQEKNTRDLYHHYQENQKNYSPLQFMQRFFKNRFIVIAAILSFIAVVTLASINFSFLAEVKYKFKTDKELAAFFGIFFAFGQFITIFTKAFLSGRVIQWLGVKRALLSLPVMIAMILGTGFIIQLFHNDYKNLIYIYGFLMMTTEVLNYALHQPMFLSLFQPLNAHLRLHGHTVIKGFVDGLGRIFAGGTILLLLFFGTTNNLMSFGLVIFILAAIWMIWAIFTEKGYLKLLQDAIRIRRLSGTAWQMNDQRVSKMITQKVTEGRPWEVIYHLQLLESNNLPLFSKLILDAVKHPKNEIRDWAIQHVPAELIEQRIDFFRDELLSDLEKENFKFKMIKLVAAHDPKAYDWGSRFIDHENRLLVQALIEGLLEGKSIEGMVLAGNKLLTLKASNEKDDKLLTCQVIENLQLRNFHGILTAYLDEPDNEVYQKAMESACQLQIDQLFLPIVNRFRKHQKQSWYLSAIAHYDIRLIDWLLEEKHLYDNNKQALESVIFIAHQIPGERSMRLLLQEEFLHISDIRQEVLHVISGFKLTYDVSTFKNTLDSWLQKEVQFLTLLQEATLDKSDPVSTAICTTESRNVQERIFNLLHILYPGKDIPGKRDAYFSLFKNKRANALENLDGLLNKMHRSMLLPLLEPNPLPRQNIDINTWFQRLIHTGHEQLTAWSLAQSIKWLHRENLLSDNEIQAEWKKSDWKIVREQIEIIQQTEPTMDQKTNNSEELMELEKVSILKNTSLFEATPENLLVDLAGLVHTVRLEKGDVLFKEGDPGNSMFIIHSGNIEILDGQRTLARFSELDFFGELSLLDDEPRSATAKAATESLLLSISQEDFYELVTFRTEVAKSVLKVLSQRLRKQNKS